MSGATDAAAGATGANGATAGSPGTVDRPAAEPAPGSGRGTAGPGGAEQGGPTQGRMTVTDAQGPRPPKPQQSQQSQVPSQAPAAPDVPAVPAMPAVPAVPPMPAQNHPQTPAPAQPPASASAVGGLPRAAGPVPTAGPVPGRTGGQAPAAAPGHQPAAPQGVAQGMPQAVRQPRPAARPVARTRSARLRIAKADPWSVMKVSFLLSIALGVTSIVAVTVLWSVLDALGVFSTLGGTIADATGSGKQTGFDLQSFLSLGNVVIATAVIAVIDVVLVTALATLAAFLYNLSAGFAGGVELTLAEDE